MNKNKTGKIISAVSVILSLAGFSFGLASFLKVSSTQDYGAAEVFKMNINSIVELKCTSERGSAYGTGLIVENNVILTNNHVCFYSFNGEDVAFEKIEYRLYDEIDYHSCLFKKGDSIVDLALLSIADGKYQSSLVLDSSPLEYGQQCYSIGNANNLGLSVISGLISIPAINIVDNKVSQAYIQSNIDIYPGSSGGGLFNSEGKLIGVTSLRLKDSSSNSIYGYGYSIPIQKAKDYLTTNS